MNIHKNARLTPLRREEMALSVVEGRLSKARAARTYGVSAKIVARWVARFEAEGRAGMADRASRPRALPGMTDPAVVERISASWPCDGSAGPAGTSRWRSASRRPPSVGCSGAPGCRG